MHSSKGTRRAATVQVIRPPPPDNTFEVDCQEELLFYLFPTGVNFVHAPILPYLLSVFPALADGDGDSYRHLRAPLSP